MKFMALLSIEIDIYLFLYVCVCKLLLTAESLHLFFMLKSKATEDSVNKTQSQLSWLSVLTEQSSQRTSSSNLKA